MPRLQHPSRGRQPFSPPPIEIARSKTRLAVSEAGQWSARDRDRRMMLESRRLKATFERLQAAIRKFQGDDKKARELGKDVAESFEQVMKFFSTHEVQQALPAESGRVIKVARDLRAHADTAHPSPAPIDAMLVTLAFAAMLLKRRLAARGS